ncbi:Rieske 2Fe-2S domain-containing protein [Candidatus Poribacteria bacterium]|nr:Rieske 2Fe-2S domain-containing protein [Candidatus Poribacteria bacterium]
MDSVTRRAFVRTAALGAATLGTGCASVPTLRVPSDQGLVHMSRGTVEPFSAAGKPFLVAPTGSTHPLIVVPNGGGGIRVFSSRCPHLGCQTAVSSARIVCPCHGSTFGLDGSVHRGPATAPLRENRVTETAGGYVIDLA